MWGGVFWTWDGVPPGLGDPRVDFGGLLDMGWGPTKVWETPGWVLGVPRTWDGVSWTWGGVLPWLGVTRVDLGGSP